MSVPAVPYIVSIAIVLLMGSSSSPCWAQTIVSSVIHTIAGYFLPLVLTIRAVHNQDYESFHSIYLTYFVFLFTILEPFSNLIRRIHAYPIAFQLSMDVFILWLLLPKSQGIRHVYHIFLTRIVHSYTWSHIEHFLTTGILRKVTDFVSMQIYPLVVHCLISHVLHIHISKPPSSLSTIHDVQQTQSQQVESYPIIHGDSFNDPGSIDELMDMSPTQAIK
jgi:hypothetical protein